MGSLLGGRRAPHATSATDGPGLHEALAAWVVWGIVAVGVWETYARFPAVELYNVSRTGFAGGAARTLVFLNWPVAIAAVAIVVVAADRLLVGPISRSARIATILTSATAVLLCSTIALPGVLDPNDLDGNWANLPAAVGVLLALVVTVGGARGRSHSGRRRDPVDPGRGGCLHRRRSSPRRRLRLEGGGAGAPARRRCAPSTWETTYLALIAVYGLAVAADDFWVEQLQKRGTVSRGVPYVLTPGPRPAWAALVAVAALVYVVAFRVGNDPGSSTARR